MKDWGVNPNGELYQYCNDCRVDNRAVWNKKYNDPAFRERVTALQKENYHTEDAYQKRELRVKCPDCEKEMGDRGLRAHVKNNYSKGRKPEV